ncbi:MAG: lamin tail domain-containing protein [Kiritimatiellae bacterium]|nr:lamin tail domain-containing protein [Kiritimatiellia bacterium]
MKRTFHWIWWGAAAAVLMIRPLVFGQYEGLVINELLPSPTNAAGFYVDANQDGAYSSFDDEFIELLNTSTNSIDVAGLWLTDANTTIRRHVFSSRILPPGGSIVVFGGGSLMNFSNPPAQISTGNGLNLNNDAETVSLFASPTTLVDQVSYQVTASHNAISYTRNPDGIGAFTNHYLATTNSARASPGRQLHGLSFLTNQPPVLLDMSDYTAFVGMELDVPIRAYDPADRDVISLTVAGNPSNATLSSTGGVGTLRFTPSEDQAGQQLEMTFIASDIDGAESNVVSFQIINPNADEDIWINEIHYDNAGTDENEGVEIAGTAGSVLSEYSLILYNGNDGKTYNSNALSGTLNDEQCGFGATWFKYPLNGLQNGPSDGIALVKGTNVIQFLSYNGILTASDGPALGMTSIDIGVREYSTTPVGYSLQLIGTGTAYSAFTWVTPRPHSRGSLNDGQEILCLAPPAIDLQKTVYLGHDGGASAPGSESVQGTNGAAVTYVFRVSNTGGTVLTNVTIQDVALGIPPIELGTVSTGMVSTSYVEAVISGDLRNTATVSGEDPDGLPVTDEDTAEVLEIISSLALQKTVYRGHDGGVSCPGADFLQATNGTPVTYCFVVENNGNTNLNALTLTDDRLGIPPIEIGTLAAGGIFSTSVEAVVTGSLTNLAIVDGSDPNSDPISDQDSATVEVINPALQLQKTVYLGHDSGTSFPGSEQVSGDSGTAITYCFAVSNTGDTTLTNVMLRDAGLSGFPDLVLGALATGEATNLYFESEINASFVNTATATAFSVIGTGVSDSDSAQVSLTVPVVTNWNTEYQVIDLGTLGGTNVAATGINDAGQVVGWSQISTGHTQAFVWANGTLTGLGFLPGGTSSVATAINNHGEIVGTADVSGTNFHAFLYITNTLVDLGTWGGPHSQALGINDNTEVTGWSYPPPGSNFYFGPYLWRSNQFIGITPYHNKETAGGLGINSNGYIAGYTVLDIPHSNRTWPMIWWDANSNGLHDQGEMKVLGTLGGQWGIAQAINASGQVVGWASTNYASSWPRHAFLVTPSNGVWNLPTYSNIQTTNLLMRDLGALGSPTNNSFANALNGHGWVVGMATRPSQTNQAFLWRDGIMTNLNDLIAASSGWVLTNATGINNQNEICGTGLYEGSPRAFVLRQEGHISRITSHMESGGIQIYTNEFDQVVTQELEHVETQIIEWVGIWRSNANSSVTFTVEYCDRLNNHNWQPFPPTSQWPITQTLWTNTEVNASPTRFFRVRARELIP